MSEEWLDLSDVKPRDLTVPRVTFAWHVPAKGGPRSCLQASRLMASILGWRNGFIVHVQVSPDLKRLLVIPAKKGKSVHGAKLAIYLPWVQSEPRPAAEVEHEIRGQELIVHLPEWAWPQDATPLPVVDRRVVMPVSEPAAAPKRQPGQRGPLARQALPASDVPAGYEGMDEDEREAVRMIETGSTGRELAEYFGWTLDRAAEFVARIRAQLRGEAA